MILVRCPRHSTVKKLFTFATMASQSFDPYKVYPFKSTSTNNSSKNDTSSTQSRRSVTLPPLPELYQPFDQLLTPIPSVKSVNTKLEKTSSVSNPFLDALAGFQNRTETWNGAAAYKSTLSPLLNAFFGLSQNTLPNDVENLLSKSWQADPDGTLRVIWNLRSIHQGKAARTMFYRAFAWLYASHPKTAIANLHNLVDPVVRFTIKTKPRRDPVAGEDDMEVITYEDAGLDAQEKQNEIEIGRSHGYWKDLLNILLLVTTDQCTPESFFSSLSQAGRGSRYRYSQARRGSRAVKESPTVVKKSPSEVRGEKYTEWHNKLTNKLRNDHTFRVLYARIAQLFADALSRDIDILKEIVDPKTSAERKLSMTFDLTLVGKWAPTPGGSHDRMTNISTAIAELLYTRGQLNVVSDIPSDRPLSQENAHKLLMAYTRCITSPLRRFLQVPEVAMSAQQWNTIKYHRVPAKCMEINKMNFLKHDADRFSQYLIDVSLGKKKISGATLLPHELLQEAMKTQKMKKPEEKTVKEMLLQVINEQWRTMITRIREAGTLDNSIAVCDVSGSMGHISDFGSGSTISPILPAVALSLVLSEIAQPPWAGKFITFSNSPEIISLNPMDDLLEKTLKMNGSKWGMNTDFNAVFMKLILPAAIEAKLKPEDMVKRIFVYVILCLVHD